MRKALAFVCLGAAGLLGLPSLMFLFVRARGFEVSDAAGVAIPIQLGLAAVLIVVSILLFRGRGSKS